MTFSVETEPKKANEFFLNFSVPFASEYIKAQSWVIPASEWKWRWNGVPMLLVPSDFEVRVGLFVCSLDLGCFNLFRGLDEWARMDVVHLLGDEGGISGIRLINPIPPRGGHHAECPWRTYHVLISDS